MRLVLRALALRALAFLTTTAGAVLLVSVCFALVPGDAIDALPNGPELRAQLEGEWGLVGGPAERVLGTFSRAGRLDFGHSLTVSPGAPVAELRGSAAARSARLLAPAALLSLLAGFAGAALAGAGAELPPSPWRPRLVRALASLSALPAVLAALATVNGVNALAWPLIESARLTRPVWFALPETDHPVRSFLAVIVLTGASGSFLWGVRRAGDTLADLAARPFVGAERARGGPIAPLLARHLVVPAARMGAAHLPLLLSALVVVERGFGMPGAGSLFWESCGRRDWPVTVGLAVVAAVTVTTARFVADALAVVFDPRERAALA